MAVFLKWLSVVMFVACLVVSAISVYTASYVMALIWFLLALTWAIAFNNVQHMIKTEERFNRKLKELKQWK